MKTTFHGWAAVTAGGPLALTEYDPGPLRAEQVQVKIESCGICHSDLSMLDNDWGNSSYPLVPGHEVVGIVAKSAIRRRASPSVTAWGSAGFPAVACPASPASPAGTSSAPARSRPSSAATADLPTGCARIGNGRSRCRRRSIRPAPGRCSAAASRCSSRSWSSA